MAVSNASPEGIVPLESASVTGSNPPTAVTGVISTTSFFISSITPLVSVVVNGGSASTAIVNAVVVAVLGGVLESVTVIVKSEAVCANVEVPVKLASVVLKLNPVGTAGDIS